MSEVEGDTTTGGAGITGVTLPGATGEVGREVGWLGGDAEGAARRLARAATIATPNPPTIAIDSTPTRPTASIEARDGPVPG